MSRRANKFLVWRVGKSVDWHCTYTELAGETGLNVSTVRSICKELGRDLGGNSDYGIGAKRRAGVDHIIAGQILTGAA